MEFKVGDVVSLAKYRVSAEETNLQCEYSWETVSVPPLYAKVVWTDGIDQVGLRFKNGRTDTYHVEWLTPVSAIEALALIDDF